MSVCSKWNWLTPPAGWSLVATDCFLGVTTVTGADAPAAGNDRSNGWPTRILRSESRPADARRTISCMTGG